MGQSEVSASLLCRNLTQLSLRATNESEFLKSQECAFVRLPTSVSEAGTLNLPRKRPAYLYRHRRLPLGIEEGNLHHFYSDLLSNGLDRNFHLELVADVRLGGLNARQGNQLLQ